MVGPASLTIGLQTWTYRMMAAVINCAGWGSLHRRLILASTGDQSQWDRCEVIQGSDWETGGRDTGINDTGNSGTSINDTRSHDTYQYHR